MTKAFLAAGVNDQLIDQLGSNFTPPESAVKN